MFDDEVSLLTEYNQWVLTKKASANDTTPETFVVERAKDQALAKVIKISEYLDKLGPYEDPSDAKIREILNG